MVPSSEPSLRDRVMDAMDTESVSVRVQNLIDLLETYGGEQATTGYRQGRESADIELRSQLYAWLGDRTSQPDGDTWDHDGLRRLVGDLLRVIR